MPTSWGQLWLDPGGHVVLAAGTVASGEGGVHVYNCRRRNRPRRMSSYKPKPNRSANKENAAFFSDGVHDEILKSFRYSFFMVATTFLDPEKEIGIELRVYEEAPQLFTEAGATRTVPGPLAAIRVMFPTKSIFRRSTCSA